MKAHRSEYDQMRTRTFEMNDNIAEETGIHIGDGMMNYYPKYRVYYIKYVGDIEEMNSYGAYIIRLLKKNYNLNNLRASSVRGTNYYIIQFCSKSVLVFKRDVLGLPLGKKDDVSVPIQILKSRKLFIPFVRGLFDTDGTLFFERKKKRIHYYPKIKIELKSKNVIKQCSHRLKELDFPVSTSYDLIQTKWGRKFKTHRLVICGAEGLKRWWNIIGSRNPKNRTKYLVWKKFGVCPPKTKIKQRQKILKQEINIKSFYKGHARTDVVRWIQRRKGFDRGKTIIAMLPDGREASEHQLSTDLFNKEVV